SISTQNTYELQNYTSILKKQHSWRFGVRLRGASETSNSPQNFAGAFTFSGGLAPQLDANNQQVLDNSGQPVLVNISSIESYRRTLLLQQLGIPIPSGPTTWRGCLAVQHQRGKPVDFG